MIHCIISPKHCIIFTFDLIFKIHKISNGNDSPTKQLFNKVSKSVKLDSQQIKTFALWNKQ